MDLRDGGDEAFDRLVELGAIDAERLPDGSLAVLIPDSVAPEQVSDALGVAEVPVSPAIGRDAGSVWVLSPRPFRVGRLRIMPAQSPAEPGALRLVDAAAFGTGLHPTTALCLEALEEVVQAAPRSKQRGQTVKKPSIHDLTPTEGVLDVGTGSGVLALAALLMGVPRALGIDNDNEALRVAAENARINALDRRLQLARGGPEVVAGTWPLVLANVLAAPLIQMAPDLVRRVGHHGWLVLSGIPTSVEPDVDLAYRHLGMRRVRSASRAGWVALVMRASW